mmetsp:Transcript_4832/g.13950  ORF Transcript_4832/g.13950 Transcript_4832/m.13950 type:complete len:224 (-) Transcript_4832:36-707(-)
MLRGENMTTTHILPWASTATGIPTAVCRSMSDRPNSPSCFSVLAQTTCAVLDMASTRSGESTCCSLDSFCSSLALAAPKELLPFTGTTAVVVDVFVAVAVADDDLTSSGGLTSMDLFSSNDFDVYSWTKRGLDDEDEDAEGDGGEPPGPKGWWTPRFFTSMDASVEEPCSFEVHHISPMSKPNPAHATCRYARTRSGSILACLSACVYVSLMCCACRWSAPTR